MGNNTKLLIKFSLARQSLFTVYHQKFLRKSMINAIFCFSLQKLKCGTLQKPLLSFISVKMIKVMPLPCSYILHCVHAMRHHCYLTVCDIYISQFLKSLVATSYKPKYMACSVVPVSPSYYSSSSSFGTIIFKITGSGTIAFRIKVLVPVQEP